MATGPAHPAGAPPPQPPPVPDVGPWLPYSKRFRGVLWLMAVATAALILLTMLQPQFRLWAAQAARGERSLWFKKDPQAAVKADPCARAASTPGCPGTRMDVLLIKPAAPARP